MEKTGYILLLIVAVILLAGVIVGMVIGLIQAFPFGIIGLVAFAGFALLFVKALMDRLKEKDDRYSDVEL